MSRALIVSATNLLRRGFLAIPVDRKSDDGAVVNALYGVARSLERALTAKSPDLAVAVIESNALELPALLAPQLAQLESVVAAHGVSTVSAADEVHVVASYAASALADGHDVTVLASDKRFAQLVGARLRWWDAYKNARYTPDMVAKRFNVPPAQVAEWLALVGDDDALEGIKGIGAKGATTLLETYGDVAAALADIDAIKGRTGNALRAAKDEVSSQVSKACLRADVELPRALVELAYEPKDADALYAELGFFELLGEQEAEPLDVVIVDTVEKVVAMVAAFEAQPVSLHAVFEDPTPARGALVGLALSPADGRAAYLPLAGKGDHLADLDALRPWLEDDAKPKTGHDVKTATVALARLGIELRGIVGDAGCASHLMEPSNWAPHDLPLVARQVLQAALPEPDAVRGVGRKRRRWSALAVPKVAEYAGRYAEVAGRLWRALEPSIDRALLDEYLALSDVLVGVEQRGIGVDAGELERAGVDFEATEVELEEQIHEHAGKSFNLGSSKQLGAVLFADLGLTVISRTKTGWSTATHALERIVHEHPIVPLVIQWRALRRMRQTWITALAEHIDDDGRGRSWFHPARSFSGRLVNSNPDLGRVPGRTEDMQRIRRAFVVGPGCVLLSVDYRQLGLYVLAHLTKDPALVEPLRAQADMHTLTAAAVLEKDASDVTVDDRQVGKVVNFATFAGQGASSLALQLAAPVAEAKALIERFDRRYALVRSFQEAQLELARSRGYIETIAHRRWPIGGLHSLDPQDLGYAERVARRATHEGSVADVSRRGLLDAARALSAAGLIAAPLLQIHDEVLFEVPTDELDRAVTIAAEAMRTTYELEVPLRVGTKVGPNWADLEPI